MTFPTVQMILKIYGLWKCWTLEQIFLDREYYQMETFSITRDHLQDV